MAMAYDITRCEDAEVAEFRVLCEGYRREYNEERSHQSLKYLTVVEFKQQWRKTDLIPAKWCCIRMVLTLQSEPSLVILLAIDISAAALRIGQVHRGPPCCARVWICALPCAP